MEQIPHPQRTENWAWVDLSEGRTWMLSIEDSNDLDTPPRLLIDQFASNEAVENWQPESQVWLHPEDLAPLIKELSGWLEILRLSAEIDAKENPRRNWGELGEPSESTRQLLRESKMASTKTTVS